MLVVNSLTRESGVCDRLRQAGSIFQLQIETFPTSHCWRTHISGISDAKGVTSDAKFASDAKLVRRSARTGALE